MIILLPDGTIRQSRRRSVRLSARIAALLVPLAGTFATPVIALLGF